MTFRCARGLLSRAVRLAFLCVLTFLAPVQTASACSCALQPVCAAFWDAERVFTGRAEVTSLGPGAQRTRFRIGQSFRGAGGAIAIESRGIGGSCDYAFVDGTRYLVFARQSNDGTWKAFTCGRTTALDQASEDLAFAQAVLRAPQRGGRVSGVVSIAELATDGRLAGGSLLGGATITLRSDAHVVSVETNLRGQYEFDAVPPARYTLTIRSSPRFEPVPPAVLTVKGPGACVAQGFAAVRKPRGN